MDISNFYEESGKADRRHWKAIGLVALLLTVFLAFVISSFNNQPTQKEIEQIIGKSSRLSEPDRFCRDLPKPIDFDYAQKKLAGNSESSYISYRYKSGLDFTEVRDFYVAYFEGNGWTRENLWEGERSALPQMLKYRKGKRTVDLESSAFSGANYSLGCGQDL